MTKTLTEVTMLPVVCFSCGQVNPETQICFDIADGVTERENAKLEAMICRSCGFDNYTHNLRELGIEEH